MKIKISNKQALFMKNTAAKNDIENKRSGYAKPVMSRKAGFSKQGGYILGEKMNLEFSSKEFKNNAAAEIIYHK